MNSPVKESAFADVDLLIKVVEFKTKFYRCPWARYEEARVGTLRLMPPERNLQILRDDYNHMQNMIFGNKPDFDEILRGVEQLEREINVL